MEYVTAHEIMHDYDLETNVCEAFLVWIRERTREALGLLETNPRAVRFGTIPLPRRQFVH